MILKTNTGSLDARTTPKEMRGDKREENLQKGLGATNFTVQGFADRRQRYS